MTMFSRFAACLVLIFCLESVISQAKAGEYLSAAQLKKLYSEAVAHGTSRRGSSRTVWYNADGTYIGEIHGRGIFFEGIWWTKEPDIYCTKSPAREKCGRIKKVGNKYERFRLDGTKSKSSTRWEYKNKP